MLVLTRNEVLDFRSLVTVAEVTISMRGLAAEILIDHNEVGLDDESAINCDGLHTVPQTLVSRHVGTIDERDLERICAAIGLVATMCSGRSGRRPGSTTCQLKFSAMNPAARAPAHAYSHRVESQSDGWLPSSAS